jgi:hypothetical protein
MVFSVLQGHLLSENLLLEEQRTLFPNIDWLVRWRAAESLGQVGVGNESVVQALLHQALPDIDADVRSSAAESLGQMEIKDTLYLCRVLIALNRCLHDQNHDVRRSALVSIRRLLDGRPIPSYHSGSPCGNDAPRGKGSNGPCSGLE